MLIRLEKNFQNTHVTSKIGNLKPKLLIKLNILTILATRVLSIHLNQTHRELLISVKMISLSPHPSPHPVISRISISI